MEPQIMTLITEHLENTRRKYLKRSVMQGLASGFAAGCSQIVYGISFKFGTYLILKKDVIPMDMYLALITLSFTSNMVGSALSYLPDYKKAIHAASLIFDIFTNPATMNFNSPDGKENITEGTMTAENVTFHYSQRPDANVLDDINLKIEAGKTIALVGPSGSGKSSFIALLERFYSVTDGEINIDKVNVEDVNLHHLRKNLALVSQEPTLFNCSIKENLLYGLTRQVPQLEIEQALQTANAVQFVYQFPQGLDTIVGEHGAQLSGGQKQRIVIARAILRKPKILLLDEATSALDTKNEKVVQEALDAALGGFTTVLVAHRLSTVMHADMIAVLKAGKIIEQGTHDELIALNGFYHDLFKKSGF